MKLQRSGLVMAALLAIVAVLALQLVRKSAECRQLAARIESEASPARTGEHETLDGGRRLDSLSGRAPHPIHDLYVDALRERGLGDPIADLITDLQRHPELIPEAGVLGGRMGFYSTERIRVLSERWIYAPFDDGHIAGEAILEFDVDRSGKISWKVIEHRMS